VAKVKAVFIRKLKRRLCLELRFGSGPSPRALSLRVCRNLTYHFLGERRRHEYLIIPLPRRPG
jgi:hypothetical protein